MSFLSEVGHWVAGLTVDDIPSRVVEKIRLQIATTVTAAAFTPWHRSASKIRDARRSDGNSLVYSSAEGFAPADAAFVNAAFAMSLDFDDYMLTGHTGYSAVLVPLAFCEELDDVVVAAVCANEVMGRLSTASLLGPLNGQMSSYIHNVGAAIALAKARRLPADQLANAAALALYQPNFCLVPGFWTDGSKTTTASMPIELGIRAAELAAQGLEGPTDLFEHPLGFPAFFGFSSYPGLLGGLGQVWLSDTLCYKRYPGTSYISAAVEAALQISGQEPISAAELDSVEVTTQILSSTLDNVGAQAIARSPLDANAVNFSLRLSVAAALCFGDLTPSHLTPERLKQWETEIRAISAKIRVVHDWSQTLRMFNASPLGLGMLVHQQPAGLLKLIHHSRRMNRASSNIGNGQSFAGLLREVPKLLGLAVRMRAKPLALGDFDAANFEMRQSARVSIKSSNKSGDTLVEIPIGACGRDHNETRQLVRWRCHEAFGSQGEAVWQILTGGGGQVAELNRAVIAGFQKQRDNEG